MSNVATCTTTATKVTCTLNAAAIEAMKPDVENQFRIALNVQTNANKLGDYLTFQAGEATTGFPALILTANAVSETPSTTESPSASPEPEPSPTSSPAESPAAPSPSSSPLPPSATPTRSVTSSKSFRPAAANTGSSGLSSGATAGVAVGVVVAVVALAVIAAALIINRRRGSGGGGGGGGAAPPSGSTGSEVNPSQAVVPVPALPLSATPGGGARRLSSSDATSPLLLAEATSAGASVGGANLSRAPAAADAEPEPVQSGGGDAAAPSGSHRAPSQRRGSKDAGEARDDNPPEHHSRHSEQARGDDTAPRKSAMKKRSTKKVVQRESSGTGTPGYDTVQEVGAPDRFPPSSHAPTPGSPTLCTPLPHPRVRVHACAPHDATFAPRRRSRHAHNCPYCTPPPLSLLRAPPPSRAAGPERGAA